MSMKGVISTQTLYELVVGLSTVTDVAKLHFTPDGCFGIVRDSKRAMKVHTALKKGGFKSYEATDCSMLFLIEDIQGIINIASHFTVEDIRLEYDGKDVMVFDLNGVKKRVICADPKYDDPMEFKAPRKWNVTAKLDAKLFDMFLRGAITVSEIVEFGATTSGIAFVTHDPHATVSLVLKKTDKKKLTFLSVTKKSRSFYGIDYLVVGSVPVCRTSPIIINFNDGGQLLLSSYFAGGNGIVECWLAPKTMPETVGDETEETPDVVPDKIAGHPPEENTPPPPED